MRCQNYVTNASRRDSPEKQDKKGQNETFLKATAWTSYAEADGADRLCANLWWLLFEDNNPPPLNP